jgi:glycine/D-amino acid oxidase-like deaminating enzyme
MTGQSDPQAFVEADRTPQLAPSLGLLGHAPTDSVSRLLRREEPIPSTADVIVIGGGIMGCCAAWYLAREKLRVVLLDRSRIASQQSGRNWGFVRTLYRDPVELPLALMALSIWPGSSTELGFETGWRRSGCVFLSSGEKEHQSYSTWYAHARDIVRDTHLMDGKETARRFPSLSRSTHGAIFAELDGQAEPTLATFAFARAAERAGAILLEECGVSAIETSGGRVCGVQTEHGPIRSPIVICAAGAQTYRLVREAGLSLPQKTVRSTVALTAPMADLGLPCFVGFGLGLRQRPDGSCIMATDAGTDIDITFDSFRASRYFLREVFLNRKSFSLRLGAPFLDDLCTRLSVPRDRRAICPRNPEVTANVDRVLETQRLFASLFADVELPRIVKSWAGNIDVMPDALPVIDGAGPMSGLAVATGFSGHGFGLGPAVGRTLAEIVLGRSPSIDLKAFAADRFTRGDYSRPHAAI